MDIADFASGFLVCLSLAVLLAAWWGEKASALFRRQRALLDKQLDRIADLEAEVETLAAERRQAKDGQ